MDSVDFEASSSHKNRVTKLERITDAIFTVFTNTTSLITIIIVAVIISNHYDQRFESMLSKIASKISDNPNVQNWIDVTETKIIGFLIFLPVLVTVKNEYKIQIVIASLLWVIFIPEHQIIQYVFQAAILRVFLRLPSHAKMERLILLAITAVLYFSGMIFDWNGSSRPGETTTPRSNN